MKIFKACFITAALLLNIVSNSAAATTGSELPNYIIECVQKESPTQVRRLQLNAELPLAIFVTKRCPGGIYLQNTHGDSLNPGKPFTAVGYGWWLMEVVSLGWQVEDQNTFTIGARYITGVGPSGMRPFDVEIDITISTDGWFVSEPKHIADAFDRAANPSF